MSDQVQQWKRECCWRGEKGETCLHDPASHHQSVGAGGKFLRMDCLCRGCPCKGFVSPEEHAAAEEWK